MTVQELADLLSGRVIGDPSVVVSGFAGAGDAGAGDLTFAADARWVDAARDSDAAVILVQEPIDGARAAQIVVKDPNLAFALAVEHMTHAEVPEPGVHGDASVHQDATIDATAYVAACAVVDAGASVGPRAFVGAGTYVGKDAAIGADCLLHANVTVAERVRLGDRVTVHSGAVVGSDGYGYATTPDGVHVKIPQTGTVVVEDDVEIGANVCIDRARFAETRVGKGTKIDNLVQVGHNVKIGPHCLIVSQAGIAGSAELGQHVVLGGHVGVTGHVKLGDGAQITAFSGVSKSLDGGQAYMGVPAIPISEGKRVRLLQMKLPELLKRVRDLERRAEEDA